jgi:hypothetical protein
MIDKHRRAADKNHRNSHLQKYFKKSATNYANKTNKSGIYRGKPKIRKRILGTVYGGSRNRVTEGSNSLMYHKTPQIFCMKAGYYANIM